VGWKPNIGMAAAVERTMAAVAAKFFKIVSR
jgi:hypothetical protein